MRGLAGAGIALVVLLLAGLGIGMPPVLDALEESGTIDLPEDNSAVFQIERLGETIRMVPEDVRLEERIQEYGELHAKYEDFWDDMEVNFEYIWQEIERQTNMTREEIIALARERINEAVEKLRQIQGPEDCEAVFGENAKIDCVGKWKTMPFRWKGEDLKFCYWACDASALG